MANTFNCPSCGAPLEIEGHGRQQLAGRDVGLGRLDLDAIDQADQGHEIGGGRVRRTRQEDGSNSGRGDTLAECLLERRQIECQRGLATDGAQAEVGVVHADPLLDLRPEAGECDQPQSIVKGSFDLEVAESCEGVAQPRDGVLNDLVEIILLDDFFEQSADLPAEGCRVSRDRGN